MSEYINRMEETKADGVAVVRCVDCRHHDYTDGLHWCCQLDRVIQPKDFCSFGEEATEV